MKPVLRLCLYALLTLFIPMLALSISMLALAEAGGGDAKITLSGYELSQLLNPDESPLPAGFRSPRSAPHSLSEPGLRRTRITTRVKKLGEMHRPELLREKIGRARSAAVRENVFKRLENMTAVEEPGAACLSPLNPPPMKVQSWSGLF